MIKIICIGNLKEKYLQEAENEYLKRLKKYTKLEIIELKEETQDMNSALAKEKEKIEQHISNNGYIIVLDINGEKLSSLELSNKIQNILATQNKDIIFIIGSSYGIHEDIKNKADLKISFSDLTFPHQLFRIMFLEQIYRSFKIINNEPYHK